MSDASFLDSVVRLYRGSAKPCTLGSFDCIDVVRFMPADALWTFAMAFNVYLTFFRKYNSEQLRRLEWKYIVLCYGLPFIPAFTYFFIRSPSRGKIYGSAIVCSPLSRLWQYPYPSQLWCWVAPSWDILRIALFYGPVWFVIFVTLAIYARIGKLVWRRRRQLKEVGGLDTTIDVSIPDDPPFSKITEIRITREDAAPFHLEEAGPSIGHNSSFAYIQSSHRPYSVNVQAGIALPAEFQLETIRSDISPDSRPPDDEPYHHSRTASEVNAATWAYTKYAMLFFVALLVTWVSHFFRSAFQRLLFSTLLTWNRCPRQSIASTHSLTPTYPTSV